MKPCFQSLCGNGCDSHVLFNHCLYQIETCIEPWLVSSGQWSYSNIKTKHMYTTVYTTLYLLIHHIVWGRGPDIAVVRGFETQPKGSQFEPPIYTPLSVGILWMKWYIFNSLYLFASRWWIFWTRWQEMSMLVSATQRKCFLEGGWMCGARGAVSCKSQCCNLS